MDQIHGKQVTNKQARLKTQYYLKEKKNITYPIYLGPPLPKPLGGHHMVPFGDHAIAVIGGQSSNLTIQDEIHVFRRVLLLLTCS